MARLCATFGATFLLLSCTESPAGESGGSFADYEATLHGALSPDFCEMVDWEGVLSAHDFELATNHSSDTLHHVDDDFDSATCSYLGRDPEALPAGFEHFNPTGMLSAEVFATADLASAECTRMKQDFNRRADNDAATETFSVRLEHRDAVRQQQVREMLPTDSAFEHLDIRRIDLIQLHCDSNLVLWLSMEGFLEAEGFDERLAEVDELVEALMVEALSHIPPATAPSAP